MKKKKQPAKGTVATTAVQYSVLRVREDDCIGHYSTGDLVPIVPVLEFESPSRTFLSYIPADGDNSDCGSFCLTYQEEDGEEHLCMSVDQLKSYYQHEGAWVNVESPKALESIKAAFDALTYKCEPKTNNLVILSKTADAMGYKLVKK